MKINFTGRNIEITPALKAYATEKLQPLEKRYNHISTIHVILLVEHTSHIAEGTIHANDTEIHATARTDDMYHSIDQLAHKLIGQLTKHKEKIIEDHR